MKTTPWMIDRTINVPFLVTVLSGVIAGAVWASTMDHRLARVEEQMDAIPAMAQTLVRMDERGEGSSRRLESIERELERQRSSRNGNYGE